MSLNKQIAKLLETKAAPKGFHFTKDGKLKRGDADQDGPGGPKLRSDPLDKQRSKIPPVSEAKKFGYGKVNQEFQKLTGKSLEQKTKEYADLSDKLARQKTEFEAELAKRKTKSMEEEKQPISPFEPGKPSKPVTPGKHGPDVSKVRHLARQAIPKTNKSNAKLARMGTFPYTEEMKETENKLSEAKRIVSTHGSGIHTAKVYRDPEYNEYQVHFFKNGKHMGEGPVSYHDDKEDAQSTADSQTKKMNVKEGATFSSFRNSLFEKTLTPAEKKKREEIAQAIERENPNMPMPMKMAIATKTAKRVAEELDDEGKMARGQLMMMAKQAEVLAMMMPDDRQLDGWVQSKLTKASDYLDSVHDYLMNNRQDVEEPDNGNY